MPRLDHLLARNLGCSRAEAKRLIGAGAVSDPAGSPLDDGAKEVPDTALPCGVRIHDQTFSLYGTSHVVLNKPAGCVTALRDGLHAVAYEYLHDAPLHADLRPVGRLDLDTTGLLLWTTDGVWLQRLTHPKRRVPRTYQAVLAGPFAPLPPELTLADGHRPDITDLTEIDAGQLHPSVIRVEGAVAFASMTITGGAYHEVRRIFAAMGNHVLSLCRVGFGRLRLPDDLAPGTYRQIDIRTVIEA
jgi:16S rRNA pseudouridine516 synthase